MKNFVIFSLFLLIVLLLPLNMVNAKGGDDEEDDKVTICHVVPNPDQTITISESALSAHLAHGDTRGVCPPPPVIPEFGLITGAVALLTSGGTFLILKKRTSKR